MANTRELRRRIRSVKNTAQITKAMQMVAATKMRRAQNQAVSGRPYNLALNEALTKLVGRVYSQQDPEDQKVTIHPLLKPNSSDKIGVLLLTTDKSLCGALNTNLFRLTQSFSQENHDVVFYTIGKKGRQFVVKSGKELVADFENHEKITFDQAVKVARIMIKAFLEGELKSVYILYPDFISALRQEPKVYQLLPIKGRPHIQENLIEEKTEAIKENAADYLLEPNKDILLDYVLNHYVETSMYQSMLETKASEHSARMMAMQNATDNARELVTDLELAYNQTRQAAITTQILEIASASAALE